MCSFFLQELSLQVHQREPQVSYLQVRPLAFSLLLAESYAHVLRRIRLSSNPFELLSHDRTLQAIVAKCLPAIAPDVDAAEEVFYGQLGIERPGIAVSNAEDAALKVSAFPCSYVSLILLCQKVWWRETWESFYCGSGGDF